MLDFQFISNFKKNNNYVKESKEIPAIDFLLLELQKGQESGYVNEETFNKKFGMWRVSLLWK